MKATGENKRCSKCHEWKHVGEYWRDRNATDGLSCQCKPCAKETNKRHHLEKPEMNRTRKRRAYLKNPEKHRERARRYAVNNPDKIKEIGQRRSARALWMKAKLAELGIRV